MCAVSLSGSLNAVSRPNCKPQVIVVSPLLTLMRQQVANLLAVDMTTVNLCDPDDHDRVITADAAASGTASNEIETESRSDFR